jgi:alkylation response protein AidB-like acyl-CoA dehydrogenase
MSDWRDALATLSGSANQNDISGDWPTEDLRALADAGAMRWAVPQEFGGDELSPLDLHLRYEEIAAESLSTALILTQRDSAVGLITASANDALKRELLPRLTHDEFFATVGIAQLTTSRQHTSPALVARPDDAGWRLSGTIPWSTGADQSKFVIAGAAVDDVQILFVLPMNLAGVRVDPPMPLVALRATHTSSITCNDVSLEDRWLLTEPMPQALSIRKHSLPIGQAFLAMGLTRGAISLIGEHRSSLAASTAQNLTRELNDVRRDVINVCQPDSVAQDTASLRGRSIELALRATHAAVAIYKGTALLESHPAQRLAREAMFLLVWSCPNPVIECTVEALMRPQR